MEYLICKLITLVSQAMPQMRTVDEDYGQLENIDMYAITSF